MDELSEICEKLFNKPLSGHGVAGKLAEVCEVNIMTVRGWKVRKTIPMAYLKLLRMRIRILEALNDK